MVKGNPEHQNNIPETPEGEKKDVSENRDRIIRGARAEAHELAGDFEWKDETPTLNEIAFLQGPEQSWPHEGKNKPDSSFWTPLNTHEYAHFGQKMLARWENDWIANIPIAGASFILATTWAIVDVARRVPGDVLSLALHPVSVYQNAKSAWDNWMDSEETWMS